MAFNTDSEVLRRLQTDQRKVDLNLVGLDGNAFVLMGTFSKTAKRQGWSEEEVEAVLAECKSSDYDHLLGVLMEFTDPLDDDD